MADRQAREVALARSEGTCPSCGEQRQPWQDRCMQCGRPLPAVAGPVAALRRGWIRRFGWYPGDWIWASLLALAVAAAGAGVAIAVSSGSSKSASTTAGSTTVASTSTQQTTTSPATTTTQPLTTTTPAATTTTTTTAPKPTANGLIAWPASRRGWTLVLGSYPTGGGRAGAVAAARRAAHAGLPAAGVLDSGEFSSLRRGYYVAFSGVYRAEAAAEAALARARAGGFPDAYPRQISR
jgi:hypothetical protein